MFILIVLCYSVALLAFFALLLNIHMNWTDIVSYKYRNSKFNIKRQIRKEKRRIMRETDPEREELLEELRTLNEIRLKDC